jgi:hypothetical protein
MLESLESSRVYRLARVSLTPALEINLLTHFDGFGMLTDVELHWMKVRTVFLLDNIHNMPVQNFCNNFMFLNKLIQYRYFK